MAREIKCRECGTWTPEDAWDSGEVPCDDCGSHEAMKCPVCGECYDSTISRWGIDFKAGHRPT